jgi:hypothetical protein
VLGTPPSSEIDLEAPSPNSDNSANSANSPNSANSIPLVSPSPYPSSAESLLSTIVHHSSFDTLPILKEARAKKKNKRTQIHVDRRKKARETFGTNAGLWYGKGEEGWEGGEEGRGGQGRKQKKNKNWKEARGWEIKFIYFSYFS